MLHELYATRLTPAYSALQLQSIHVEYVGANEALNCLFETV